MCWGVEGMGRGKVGEDLTHAEAALRANGACLLATAALDCFVRGSRLGELLWENAF